MLVDTCSELCSRSDAVEEISALRRTGAESAFDGPAVWEINKKQSTSLYVESGVRGTLENSYFCPIIRLVNIAMKQSEHALK